MSYLLGPPPKIISNGGGPNDAELITLRPSPLVTGTWLILQCQNRAPRQAPKRPLPTPSRSADGSHAQSIASSIEGPQPNNRNDAFAPSGHYQTESSAQSQRAASAPPFRLDAEPYIKKDTSYTADNSYRSIFRENFDTNGTFPSDSTSSQQTDFPIGAESITQGCRLLSILSNRWVVNDFIDKWYEVCEGADDISIVGIVKGWLRKLWLCHGDVLESQDTDSMYRLSELLWRNTQAPLVFNGTTTAAEWIDLATGPNIRWEVIGIIAAVVGICARYCEASHAIFQKHNVDRLNLAKQATHVSNTCVAFAQKCAAVNDILLWLLVEDHICSALVRGVHTYDSYRQTGEIVSAIVFLKWHQKIEANESVPHFLVELRKRARASAYCAEIGSATFLGRPPRASYHYWDLDAPSDLTDSQLMMSNEEIEALLAQMDEYGYNRTGRLHRGTWYRVWLGFAQRREDVLELTLRNCSNEELLRKASDIERKTEEHWQRVPAWIREARHQKFNPTQNLLEQLYLTVIRHGTRGNELMLQRLLIRRKVATSEKLIQISQTIFKEVLEVGHSPDMVSKFQLDITSILVVHGLRAAIIIAAELFKQEQLPVYPKEPLLPRSQTIQDLSVFAARLGVVDPNDSMYDMSQDGRRMLIFVLDKILAPKPSDQSGAVAGPQQPCAGPHDNGNQQDQQQDQLQQQQQMLPPQQLGEGPMEVETASNAGVAYMPGMGSAMPTDFGFGPPDWIINEDDSMFMQWLDSVDWGQMGPLGALIDPWQEALRESSDVRRDELPSYHGENRVQSLITTSNPQSFELGTGASIYTNSLLPAILKARSEVILVTCFWAPSATLTALKDTLEQLAEHRRQLVQEGGPDATPLPQLRIRIFFSSRSLFQKLFHTTSRDGYVYPPEKWQGTLGLPSPDLLRAGGIELQVKSLFFLPFSVMHPKFLVVDRQRAWLPSCNVSWESWLEGCVEITGDAVQQLMAFYRDVWEQELDLGHNESMNTVFDSLPALQTTASTSIGLRTIQSPARRFASFEGPAVPTVLLPSSHHQNPRFRPLPWHNHPAPPSTPLNAAILRLIAMAQRTIYVQTPNLTSAFVINSLLDALERGVQVTIVTSKGMMLLEQIVTSGTTTALCLRSLVRRYNKLVNSRTKPRSITSASSAEPMIDLEAGRQRIGSLKISYFHANLENAQTKVTEEPVHSHLKLTIVDDEYTILGSGNMDRASWFTSQELGILFHSTEFAKTVSDTVAAGLGGRTRTIFNSPSHIG